MVLISYIVLVLVVEVEVDGILRGIALYFDVLDLVVEVEDDGISGIALYFGKSSKEQD